MKSSFVVHLLKFSSITYVIVVRMLSFVRVFKPIGGKVFEASLIVCFGVRVRVSNSK